MNESKKTMYMMFSAFLLLSGCVSNSYQERRIPDESVIQSRPSLKYPDFRLGILPDPVYIEELKTK